VVSGLAVVAPPVEADAGLEADCGPRRSGTRTTRCFEGEYLGSLATFTVPALATDPD
jgi:hypothetical protein